MRGEIQLMVECDPFSDEAVEADPRPICKPPRNLAPACFLEQFESWVLSHFQIPRRPPRIPTEFVQGDWKRPIPFQT
jgi:hypothetical protein